MSKTPPFDIPSAVPQSGQEKLKSKNENLTKAMLTPEVTKMKGGDGCQGDHDLLRLHSDPEGVMHHAAEMGLSVRKDTASSLQIHEENMPTMKAEGATEEMKGLEPEEMCVGRKLGTTLQKKSTKVGECLLPHGCSASHAQLRGEHTGPSTCFPSHGHMKDRHSGSKRVTSTFSLLCP
ncbi:nuclear RNA export factor 3-like [Echinops telfairi]|uniref:Nuclear RNA export factor 3-like n=1 Tax=Echinops telfairi TaxID=9371 RepID=A0AC55D4Q1_ECHTE|nr:nuclear RNA export factor 3-like [Echinops telfairi]